MINTPASGLLCSELCKSSRTGTITFDVRMDGNSDDVNDQSQ